MQELVRIFVQEDSRIVSSELEYDPIGIAMKGMLKSELYGLQSTLAREGLAKLDRYYGLLRKERRTPSRHELMHWSTGGVASPPAQRSGWRSTLAHRRIFGCICSCGGTSTIPNKQKHMS
jgi:hypothetical protein